MKTNKIYAKTPTHFQKNDSFNEPTNQKQNFFISFFQKFQRKSKKFKNDNNPISQRFNTNIEEKSRRECGDGGGAADG